MVAVCIAVDFGSYDAIVLQCDVVVAESSILISVGAGCIGNGFDILRLLQLSEDSATKRVLFTVCVCCKNEKC